MSVFVMLFPTRGESLEFRRSESTRALRPRGLSLRSLSTLLEGAQSSQRAAVMALRVPNGRVLLQQVEQLPKHFLNVS